jgi:hypothetical protein
VALAHRILTLLDQIRELPPITWLRAIPYTLIAAVVIAIPSDLIDTALFGRPVDPRGIDYVILAVTAALIGTILAIRPEQATVRDEQDQTRTVWGGFVSFLAVGCPVCNQAVVALIGTSGALSWWAPVQPVVGLLAIALLVHTLRRRLDTYRLAACPIPV